MKWDKNEKASVYYNEDTSNKKCSKERPCLCKKGTAKTAEKEVKKRMTKRDWPSGKPVRALGYDHKNQFGYGFTKKDWNDRDIYDHENYSYDEKKKRYTDALLNWVFTTSDYQKRSGYCKTSVSGGYGWDWCVGSGGYAKYLQCLEFRGNFAYTNWKNHKWKCPENMWPVCRPYTCIGGATGIKTQEKNVIAHIHHLRNFVANGLRTQQIIRFFFIRVYQMKTKKKIILTLCLPIQDYSREMKLNKNWS